MGKFDTYKTLLPQLVEDSKISLENKKLTVSEDFKLKDLPNLIANIETGSKVEIVVTALDYEGQELTAELNGTQLKETVQDGTVRFAVEQEGTWKVSADDGNSINVEVKMKFSGTLTSTKVYGVKITESTENPEARVTYTDNAIGMTPVKVNLEDGTTNYNGWEDTWIFDKIYPAMVKTDGSIAYKLDPEDQSQKAEGGASEVNSFDFDGNAMVVVEKFYTKFSMDGEKECIQISDEEEDGFEAIGFIREDGSEADYICLPMFMGSFDSSNKLRSISGQSIKYSTSFTDFRTAAQKNGSTYDIEVYAMNEILMALYLILFKTCDWRNTLGEGRTYNQGNTGVLVNKGGIAFDPNSKATKFLWIEDYVSWPRSGVQMYRWEAGVLQVNKELYVRMKPPYSGTDTSTYTKVPDYVQMQKYMSKMKCSNEYGRYSLEGNGSETTYETSYWYGETNTSGNVYISRRGNNYGVAGRAFYSSASDSNSDYGAALSLVPPA